MPKYKLLDGRHSESGRVWKRGQVVETAKDLLKHNRQGLRKFEQVHDDTPADEGQLLGSKGGEPGPLHENPAVVPALPVNDTLSSMSLEELQKLAASEGINLGKARTQEQILKVIRAAT